MLNACRFFGCLPSQLLDEDISLLRLMDLHSLLEERSGE